MEQVKIKALRLIKESTHSLMGSLDSDGYPYMKALLAPRRIEGLKSIYFSTNTSSLRVQQFVENPKSSLYFYNGETFRGVLLIGKMEILTTPVYKELIWETGDEYYYPLGVSDPDYCVLRFTPEKGRFYSEFKSDDFSI